MSDASKCILNISKKNRETLRRNSHIITSKEHAIKLYPSNGWFNNKELYPNLKKLEYLFLSKKIVTYDPVHISMQLINIRKWLQQAYSNGKKREGNKFEEKVVKLHKEMEKYIEELLLIKSNFQIVTLGLSVVVAGKSCNTKFTNFW